MRPWAFTGWSSLVEHLVAHGICPGGEYRNIKTRNVKRALTGSCGHDEGGPLSFPAVWVLRLSGTKMLLHS